MEKKLYIPTFKKMMVQISGAVSCTLLAKVSQNVAQTISNTMQLLKMPTLKRFVSHGGNLGKMKRTSWPTMRGISTVTVRSRKSFGYGGGAVTCA